MFYNKRAGHLRSEWDLECPKELLDLLEILKLQKIIVPEMVELLVKRYNIIRTIYYNQPIGRRALANNLNLGERIVRTEIGFLKSQNLIQINTPGMSVTQEGEFMLEYLKGFIHEIKGLSNLEKQLCDMLHVRNVIVVPGDCSEDENTIKELGKAAANYSKNIIKDGYTIAVTGGSTVKEVIDELPEMANLKNVLVVPARGGMGKKVETQSNTLAANLAKKLNGTYKMLHVPDNISKEVMDALMKQEDMKELIQNIKNADMLIYGIGQAKKMANKRGVPKDQIIKLLDLGAIGEAFGCYFNDKSEVVYVMPTLGVTINDLRKIKNHIAVAGGKNKAEAILTTVYGNENAVLITDEGAANEILNFLNRDE